MEKLFRLLMLFLFASPSFSANLIEVYYDALDNDQTYQAARADYRAKREALPQSIAALLPFADITGHSTYNRFEASSSSIPAPGFDSSNNYNTNGYTLSLEQSVVNVADWFNVSRANSSVKAAKAALDAAAQDLMIRTADAYFGVLRATDNLRFTVQERKTNARQLDQAKQRFKVGVDAITSVHEAQASYDAVVADEIAAKNELSNSFERLREITGFMYKNIAEINGYAPLVRPQPDDPSIWLASADKNNLALLASRFERDAAKKNVVVNFSGHFPTLNAFASYQDANGDNRGFGSFDTETEAYGLRARLPLFEGGLTSSRTREASYRYKESIAKNEGTHRATVRETNQQFTNVISGISKIRADRQRIISSKSSFKSTEEAFKVGTRTIVDVLITQRNLFQAQRDHAGDQYDYIINSLKLKQAAGILNAKDLEEINAWLKL